MKSNFLKKGMIIAAIAGAFACPVQSVMAAEGVSVFNFKKEATTELDANMFMDTVSNVKKETRGNVTIKIESAEEMQFKALFENKAFASTEKDYVLVYADTEKNNNWVGKLQNMDYAEIVEETEDEDWVLVQSGEILGYVETEKLLMKADAAEAAKVILEKAFPGTDIYTLEEEAMVEVFTVGESREQEAARLAEEAAAAEEARIAAEEARIAAEEAARRQRGENLVDYAMGFVGNPYVYGGTSLTYGADCSGFVLAVYANYGIYLPHSSYAMRGYGESVEYSDLQPGDIVCYSGHVAIYAGDGMVVHAINESRGIGVSYVGYQNIITIRRLFN